MGRGFEVFVSGVGWIGSGGFGVCGVLGNMTGRVMGNGIMMRGIVGWAMAWGVVRTGSSEENGRCNRTSRKKNFYLLSIAEA
jgi:hypothetical protein